jgi:hypothetical protein
MVDTHKLQLKPIRRGTFLLEKLTGSQSRNSLQFMEPRVYYHAHKGPQMNAENETIPTNIEFVVEEMAKKQAGTSPTN